MKPLESRRRRGSCSVTSDMTEEEALRGAAAWNSAGHVCMKRCRIVLDQSNAVCGYVHRGCCAYNFQRNFHVDRDGSNALRSANSGNLSELVRW